MSISDIVGGVSVGTMSGIGTYALAGTTAALAPIVAPLAVLAAGIGTYIGYRAFSPDPPKQEAKHDGKDDGKHDAKPGH
jgi:hypothetical protein